MSNTELTITVFILFGFHIITTLALMGCKVYIDEIKKSLTQIKRCLKNILKED